MIGTVWDLVWTSFLIFLFVVYLFLLAGILRDLFRDAELNGWFKVLWVVLLVALPYIAVFVYLVVRGRGMADRSVLRSEDSKDTLDTYIRATAIASPSAEIARAKSLFDSGAINENEFNALKTKVLST